MKRQTDKFNYHSDRVHAHYLHALKKHQTFCDVLFKPLREKSDGGPERHLELARKLIRQRARRGDLDFIDLADCEVAEMFDAYMKGDNAAAVEECYDIIAVFLRAIDVIEGRQALGKHKKRKGGAA